MVKAAPLLPRLPAPMQARLRAMGENARDLFGGLRDLQTIFDEHIGFLDELKKGGATDAMLGLLLAEVGIARADGSPTPQGTISSALSRARERATARGGPPVQALAGGTLQAVALARTDLPMSAEPCSFMPDRAEPCTIPHFTETDPPLGDDPMPPDTERAATLLNELRRKK